MCINCSDFVESCSKDGCYNPDGGPYGRIRKFYLGDTLCEHLVQEYGTESASLLAHLRRGDEHELECSKPVNESCIYTFNKEELQRVLAALEKDTDG